MTSVQTLVAQVNDLADATRDLARVLDAALAVQWQAPPVARPREDTSERSKGAAPADPTADVALDERRLALRSAIGTAEESLRLASASTRAATARVERALAAYEDDGGPA